MFGEMTRHLTLPKINNAHGHTLDNQISYGLIDLITSIKTIFSQFIFNSSKCAKILLYRYYLLLHHLYHIQLFLFITLIPFCLIRFYEDTSMVTKS